ncbi:TPA: helix-turn-helix transcriptional regulator [Clostridioides difficile]|uniref:Helix-turn-helix transcriptional regulator n=2 Tax=Clostridioides difficile TaxID=1496 RepID=A0A9X8RKF7_CLODI|nr:helix-turn-helix transcriptional regulator [Clostridioides difficile]EQK93111.1 cro/C1-type HTH DNA-binding domain protein [Clostridioides difficile CD127]MCC0634187.1 helix-turn-helix transcriptional regulator [Clostridioides sp. ZZV15-6388]DAG69451.1 MAG TPA: Cro/C1-type HTH DNA-binding domain protein [Caudoviricetes sp.]EGT3651636.1 XRE family transcriptional regulator [Clostridioides difficile]EGT3711052.1 XRE family transcriptional regulator [Clostridioides difficile]
MYFNIDKLLESKGRTRYWLAKEVGIAYPNMMKLANNETSSIKLDLFEKLCLVLECTPNELVTLSSKE